MLYLRVCAFSDPFSDKEGFDRAPDKLPTDRTLPHGGGAVLTTGQVTTGQEGYGHVLLHADLTQDLVLQARVLHLQRSQLCNKSSTPSRPAGALLV